MNKEHKRPMAIGGLVPEFLRHKVLKGADISNFTIFSMFDMQCLHNDKSDQVGFFKDCVQAFK